MLIVGSVVYPQACPYLKEWLESLANQTDQDFLLVVVNDGVKDIHAYFKGYRGEYIVIEKKGSISSNRRAIIEYAILTRAESIMWLDADDWAKPQRVKVCKQKLQIAPIIFNQMLVVNERGQKPKPLWASFYQDGSRVSFEDLLHYNVLGLTNTAVRVSVLADFWSDMPKQTQTFDWDMYAMLLSQLETEAVYTEETATYYRQYAQNTASLSLITPEQFVRVIEMKSDHFWWLSQIDRRARPYRDIWARQLRKTKRKTAEMYADYCQRIETSNREWRWWEAV